MDSVAGGLIGVETGVDVGVGRGLVGRGLPVWICNQWTRDTRRNPFASMVSLIGKYLCRS